MAYQLIYTSVSRGLIPGRSGYTVAARHRQIRERLVSDIERISGYTFSTTGVSPVIYAHRMISCSGKEYHVLTRNMDAGSDYTGRTNHLAHHLICEPEEIAGCGASPAEILHGFKWLESYGEAPRYLEDHEIVDLSQFAGTFELPAKNWQGVRGEAGDAALLIDEQGKPTSAFVVASSGGEEEAGKLLGMYAESLCLATSVDDIPARWKASFTTYLQQIDTLADFDWAGCTEDQALLQRPGNRLVLNLAALGVPTPDSKQAKLAVSGRVDPPPPTHIPPVSTTRPDALQQHSPVPQPDVGVRGARQAGQSRRVRFTPVNTQGEGQDSGPVKLPGSNPIPLPSVSIRSSGESKLDFLKRPENLRLVIGGVAAAVLIVGLLFYYLFSVHPRQDFESEVKGHLANHYWQGAMDVIDKEKENMEAELIEDLRRDVIRAMIAQAEEVNERFASEKGENVKKLQDEVSGKLEELVKFEEKYDVSNEDIEDLVASFERIKKTKIKAGSITAGNPGLASSGKGTPPGGVTEPKEKVPGKEVVAGNGKNPSSNVPAAKEQKVELPNTVYLFLNQDRGQLGKVELHEDWRREEGENRKFLFQHYILGGGDSFLTPSKEGKKYAYDPNSTDRFPIQGENESLNVNVRVQGFSRQFLSKSKPGGNNKEIVDVWDVGSSNLLALGEGDNTSHVLLWNGKEFKTRKPIVKKVAGRVVLEDSLWQYLSALHVPDDNSTRSREMPQKVYLRYLFYDGKKEAQEEKNSLASCYFPLNPDDRDKLAISFEGQSPEEIRQQIDQGEKVLKNVELQISWWAWAEERKEIRDGLERTIKDFIGGGLDKEDFPNLFKHGKLAPEDFREEILDFVQVLSEKFPDQVIADRKIFLEVSDQLLFRPIFSWQRFISGDFADEDSEDDREERSDPGLNRVTRLRARPNAKMTDDDFVKVMDRYCDAVDTKFTRDKSGQWTKKLRGRVKEFTSKIRFQFSGDEGKELWNLADRQPESSKPPVDRLDILKDKQKKIMSGLSKREKTLKIVKSSKGSDVRPGVYQLVLVFDGAAEQSEDRERTFVIWSKEGKGGR